jgi:DNA (cytosine-5)-methyltransferase 1
VEEGLRRAGHSAVLLSEIDPFAQRVLRRRFPDVAQHSDVRTLRGLPDCELVAAGFPCQDLSSVGRVQGIDGRHSSLVEEVFRLVEKKRRKPEWLLFENVPFMLRLDRGRAMSFLAQRLASMGYSWAYRVVDLRAFGLPQRRKRVILLASRNDDPRSVLFAGNHPPRAGVSPGSAACGFYWTEGNRGLGWAVDAIPTLKGGSGLGIPSAPAIWSLDGRIGTPDIRDAERLQGFSSGWTRPAEDGSRLGRGTRWRLVGNAVPVPVAEWVGHRISLSRSRFRHPVYENASGSLWPPAAAFGDDTGRRFAASLSEWPVRREYRHLQEFLGYPLTPLSPRATAGFITRIRNSSLRVDSEWLQALDEHLELVRRELAVAA